MQGIERYLPPLAAVLLATACLTPALAADVTQQRLENADSEPQNWMTVFQNYSNHRYSRLDQVNRDTVKNLHVAFTIPIQSAMEGTKSAELENAPLVIDGMMYFNDEWGTIYKVDVSSGTSGATQWIADPAVDKGGPQVIRTTRGIAAYGNRVYANLIDGRVIAVNMESGEIEWDRQVTNTEDNWEDDVGETFTAAPLATEGKILVGQSLGDVGTRGWLEAVDAETGEKLWRTYTIPAPGEPGSETWKDDHNAWHTGGGSLWVTGAYDPEQKVTIWGTANPVPMFDPEFRPGDNLFTNSAIAFNIDDGSMKWYFQYTPNESWDYDEVAVHFLYDANVDGQDRKLVGHFARNGFFYQLDRTNGQFIAAAQNDAHIGWTAGIDPKTGKPVEYDPSLDVQTYIPATRQRRADNRSVQACPTMLGGIRWQPTAYNPDTHIGYSAGLDGCNSISINNPDPLPGGGNPNGPGKIWLGGDVGPELLHGRITAMDMNGPKLVAYRDLPFENLSGVLATKGGLIFTGEMDGNVVAYDDKTLEPLWQFSTGISFKAPAIAYAIGDKEYIAIIAGGPGAPGGHPELANMRAGAMLYVFSL